MGTGEDPKVSLPAWQPHAHIAKLTKSLSKDNLQTLQRVSQDIKKNGETLLLTASNHPQVHRFKSSLSEAQSRLASVSDDFALLKRVGTPTERKRPVRTMRRSQSDNDFRALQLRFPRMVTKSPLGEAGASASSSSRTTEGESWDLLSALNTTLNQARAGSRPVFPQLPTRRSFEEQAKQLVHSASAQNLTTMGKQLLQKPVAALETAQATLETCQQNLQQLQASLQASLAESRSRLQILADPAGSPLTGVAGTGVPALGTLFQLRRLSDSGIPSQRGSTSDLQRQGSEGSSGEEGITLTAGQAAGGQALQAGEPVDATLPWAVLPGYLRAKEIAAIEDLIADDEGSGGSGSDEAEGPSTSGPWAPLQGPKGRHRRGPRGSSLREDGRQIAIVTTAALPWMTGTAVNPLLRAAYLARDKARKVTLMIPWLAKCDQSMVFPNNMTFDTPEEQEKYVRDWVKKRTGFDSEFKVTFYPGRYAPEKCSILPVGDPTQYIPEHEADVAILEEPEHLNWYHHGRRWTDKFNHVVGVVHTNYLDYARREESGGIKEAILRHVNNWVCRAYCHKVVKLSDAVQPLPKQTTEFVHGVAESFLDVGRKKAQAAEGDEARFSKGAYFIGKVVWAKGYTELLELLSKHHKSAEVPVHIDCYGTGEDLPAVKEEAAQRELKMTFHGAKDHLDESMHDYMVFINPSTSDVVATTSAEALAMGKWVICAEHPSNHFFSTFRNCLIYRTPQEFSQHLEYALANEPHPMSAEEVQRLTWDAATERFLDVTELRAKDLRPGPLASVADNLLWATHNALTGIEPLRAAAGAGAFTRDNPQRLVDFDPTRCHVGGIFDDKKRLAAKANGGNGASSTQAAAAAAKDV